MLPPIASLFNPKAVLRERMKSERKAAAKARPDAGVHAAKNFMSAIDRPKGAVVSLYLPMRSTPSRSPQR